MTARSSPAGWTRGGFTPTIVVRVCPPCELATFAALANAHYPEGGAHPRRVECPAFPDDHINSYRPIVEDRARVLALLLYAGGRGGWWASVHRASVTVVQPAVLGDIDLHIGRGGTLARVRASHA